MAFAFRRMSRMRRFSSASNSMSEHIRAVSILKEHGFRVRGDVYITIEAGGVTSKFKVTKDVCHLNIMTNILISRDVVKLIPKAGFTRTDILKLWNENNKKYAVTGKFSEILPNKVDINIPLL